MGVGGNFWDMLKPYARTEGFDFLRNKKVAVDLSFWIVQHETAIKAHTRNPHLRLTFFRTINLLSKFGAFPVFVTDGMPSPLKSQARIMRFLQASGIDLSGLPVADGTCVERNKVFLKCVQECVELLELFGMPVLKASGEAEGLCAQLNREGHVDACITSDSDAFLFGAKCIIKRLKPNSPEPFECYHMSDIEAGLGLKRNHLIAIALLVGNDHDLKGVQGIGLETALSFVKSFGEDEVLERLREIGSGKRLRLDESTDFDGNPADDSDENARKTRLSHCSLCGHPGTKKTHFKDSCERCCGLETSKGCTQKPVGFKCDCSSCDLDKKQKEQKKNKAWEMKVCKKMAAEQNFPNDAIIRMYLNENHGSFSDSEPPVSWKRPDTEILIDYVTYRLNWDPAYVRQKLFPTLTTAFLRDVASDRKPDLVFGQYGFDSIRKSKIRFGLPLYVVVWKKPAQTVDEDDAVSTPVDEAEIEDDFGDVSDDADVGNVRVDNGFLTTDENRELVDAAYPVEVCRFVQQQKESKRKKSGEKSESDLRSVQLNITEFYRSSKEKAKAADKEKEKAKRNGGGPNFSKSVRRRLLFG